MDGLAFLAEKIRNDSCFIATPHAEPLFLALDHLPVLAGQLRFAHAANLSRLGVVVNNYFQKVVDGFSETWFALAMQNGFRFPAPVLAESGGIAEKLRSPLNGEAKAESRGQAQESTDYMAPIQGTLAAGKISSALAAPSQDAKAVWRAAESVEWSSNTLSGISGSEMNVRTNVALKIFSHQRYPHRQCESPGLTTPRWSGTLGGLSHWPPSVNFP